MSKRLYVGNLPYAIDDEQLQKLFKDEGVESVISAKVIMDKFSGRSKGFGFVEIEKDDEMESAIQKVNGKDMGGRPLVVNEARPMEERPNRGFGGGGDRGGQGGQMRDFRPRETNDAAQG